tara:strand:- start:725 stop:2314 length:1590 start_codon:yes stop_codon:yes gene_type:complete
MSYLQFGGRNQNLKSSSLENLKVQSRLTVLSTSTLSDCRFITKFKFAEDANDFDINAYRRFFSLKFATDATDINFSNSTPLEYFDVSNIRIRSAIISSGLTGEFTDLAIDNDFNYKNILSTKNLISFGDISNNYTSISGVSNLAIGYNALRDFSGNNNIVVGSSLIGTGTGVIDSSGNNNIIIGNNNTLNNKYSDNSIVISNNLNNALSNTIYLGSNQQTNLYTYSNVNIYNGFNIGLDVSNVNFKFNNMCDYGVEESNQSIISTENTGSLLRYYAARNYLQIDSGIETTGGSSYNWKIFIHDNDTVANNVGISRSLIFLSPSQRAYFLRDDAISDNLNPTSSINITSFTGQHSVILSENISDSEVGKIVISTGIYDNFSSGVSNSLPTMNEALPLVDFTNKKNDKRCFGVISYATKMSVKNGVYTYNEGAWSTQISSEIFSSRCWVNSIGEGAILITNANGNLENGDFITTSQDSGYGIKQDDDILHSYTVAKITEDMDFSDMTRVKLIKLNDVIRKVCLVGCTYHCG